MFLADNIGNNTSVTSIVNTLVNEKMIDIDKRNGRPAVQTIQAYVGALLEAFIFMKSNGLTLRENIILWISGGNCAG